MIEAIDDHTITDDDLFPRKIPKTSIRARAIALVISKLDWEIRGTLRAKGLSWFIPPANDGWGCALRVTKKCIYLSPMLETMSVEFAVATVAHEFAHVFLRHRKPRSKKHWERNEKEAWDLIVQWGFKGEKEEHDRLNAAFAKGGAAGA